MGIQTTRSGLIDGPYQGVGKHNPDWVKSLVTDSFLKSSEKF